MTALEEEEHFQENQIIHCSLGNTKDLFSIDGENEMLVKKKKTCVKTITVKERIKKTMANLAFLTF